MFVSNFLRKTKLSSRGYAVEVGSVNRVNLIGYLKIDPKIFTNSKNNSQFASFYLITSDHSFSSDGMLFNSLILYFFIPRKRSVYENDLFSYLPANAPKGTVETEHRVVVSDANDVATLKAK